MENHKEEPFKNYNKRGHKFPSTFLGSFTTNYASAETIFRRF